MNRTPHESLAFGVALLPQSVADGGTANGPRITLPQKLGEHLTFVLTLGAQTAVSAFKVVVQGSNDQGTTWTTLKKNDGTTDLAFTGTKFIAAGAYASKAAMGSINPRRGKYQDYRLRVETVTGAASLISASYIISPVERSAVGMTYPGAANAVGTPQAEFTVTDELLNDFLPTGAL